jgi:hypothetical protein
MSKRSEKSRYPSIYAKGSYVTAAQFLGEMTCKRAAYKENKELPQKFWDLPKWRKFLVWQIALANKLLKKYDDKVIFKALRDPKGRNIYSLGAPHLKEILDKYAAMPTVNIDKELEELETSLGMRPQSENKKSLRSRLDD